MNLRFLDRGDGSPLVLQQYCGPHYSGTMGRLIIEQDKWQDVPVFKQKRKPREYFILNHEASVQIKEYDQEKEGPLTPSAGWIHVCEVLK